VRLAVRANGRDLGARTLDRPGLFVYEADLPEADQYRIEIAAEPRWQAPGDDRVFTVNLSMIRLAPRETEK